MKLDQVLSGHGLGGGKYRVGSQLPFDYFGLEEAPRTVFKMSTSTSDPDVGGICRDNTGALYTLFGTALTKYALDDKTVVATATEQSTAGGKYTDMVYAGGHIFVCSYNQSNSMGWLGVYDTNLTFIQSLGSGEGYDLCVSPDGQYVYFARGSYTYKYNATDLTLIWQRLLAANSGSNTYRVTRVEVDSTGHYYVMFYVNNTMTVNFYVRKYNDADGVKVWDSPLDNQSGIDQQCLAVVDENTIYGRGTRYDASGALVWTAAYKNTYGVLGLGASNGNGVIFADGSANLLVCYNPAGVEQWRIKKPYADGTNATKMLWDYPMGVLWLALKGIWKFYTKLTITK